MAGGCARRCSRAPHWRRSHGALSIPIERAFSRRSPESEDNAEASTRAKTCGCRLLPARSHQKLAAKRSGFRCALGPSERRPSDRHRLADVDNWDNIDVVPKSELRDERGDDLGIAGFNQDVTAVDQVRHERVDRQALLRFPLAESNQ